MHLNFFGILATKSRQRTDVKTKIRPGTAVSRWLPEPYVPKNEAISISKLNPKKTQKGVNVASLPLGFTRTIFISLLPQ